MSAVCYWAGSSEFWSSVAESCPSHHKCWLKLSVNQCMRNANNESGDNSLRLYYCNRPILHISSHATDWLINWKYNNIDYSHYKAVFIDVLGQLHNTTLIYCLTAAAPMEIAGSLAANCNSSMACLGFVAEIKQCVLDRNMMRANLNSTGWKTKTISSKTLNCLIEPRETVKSDHY